MGDSDIILKQDGVVSITTITRITVIVIEYGIYDGMLKRGNTGCSRIDFSRHRMCSTRSMDTKTTMTDWVQYLSTNTNRPL